MRIGLGTRTRMMVGRIVGAGLRAQLLTVLRAVLSKFSEYLDERCSVRLLTVLIWELAMRSSLLKAAISLPCLALVVCSHDMVDLSFQYSSAYIVHV